MPKTTPPNRIPALVLVALLSAVTAAHADTTTPALATAAPLTSESFWSWTETVLWPFQSAGQWVGALFSREDKPASDEIEHFKHSIDTDLSSFETLVQQAGFRVATISVGASLTPKISLALVFERRLSEPEKTALMAKITRAPGAVGTIQRGIIMTLLNAAESVYAVRNDGYRLSGVDIDVGTVPNATFVLTKGR